MASLLQSARMCWHYEPDALTTGQVRKSAVIVACCINILHIIVLHFVIKLACT